MDRARASQGDDPLAVSIVVPAHDAAATILPCVRSALAQDGCELEVIVVDDGSTDGTEAVLAAVADPRLSVHRQEQRGVSAARNAGLRVASGDIVAFLDADDLLLPSYARRVSAIFAADPGIDFVYSDAWTFDERTRRVRINTTAHYTSPPRPSPENARDLFAELVERNFMIIPVAVRSDVLREIGGFDVGLTHAEDWHLWLRLAGHGHRGREAPGPLGLRREHPRQASIDALRMNAGTIAMFRRLLAGEGFDDERRALLRARLTREHHEHAILTGENRIGYARRSARRRLGAWVRRAGYGARWYDEPPREVVDAWGDLSSI